MSALTLIEIEAKQAEVDAKQEALNADNAMLVRARFAMIAGTGVEQRAAQYLFMRDELERMDKQNAGRAKPLQDIKSLLEGYFDKFLTSTGQQTAVTKSGTIHWNNKTTAKLEDAQAFMEFVIANKRFDMLDRRANATIVKEYAAEHGALPPGVKLNPIRTIGVRVPGAKAKGG